MPIYEPLFAPTTKRANVSLRQLPPMLDTGWRPLTPWQWPDPRGCTFISHDIEAKELDFDYGPGWGRGQVSIVGHALTLYWGERAQSLYIPTRHEVDRHLNQPVDQADAYVKQCLMANRCPKGYANGLYDVGTASEENIWVQGELHDVQFVEALLSEDENVNLDALAKKYLDSSKDTNALYEWCAAAYGGEATGSQRGNIYRASPILVGPYAEQDSALIRPVLQKQWPILEAEGLVDLYHTERALIRLLVRMRRQGVRIDLDYTEQMHTKVRGILAEKIAEFKRISGVSTVNSCPSGDIAKAFDAFGLKYRLTEKTKKPSITADDLKANPHPIAQLALEIRQHDKIEGTFLRGTLLERHRNGVVHGSFEPLRGDEGGARSGRFVSNNPNLQTIPIRTELGKQIRKAFVPFVGHMCWEKNDFSQYEYRILAHAAVGPGSAELRAKYQNDPLTDYHQATQDAIKANAAAAYAAWELQGLDHGKIRKRVKTVNFGMMNLMGLDLLAATLGISTSEAEPLLKVYHASNPYIKATVAEFEEFARTYGYVQTVAGRRSRFNLWEPAKKQWIESERRYQFYPALRQKAAYMEYGSNIVRARCHIALNRYTQGSNADGLKIAMAAADRDGVFDVIGVPTLTVHDELDFSVIDDSRIQNEAYAHLRYLMENALPLSVPIRVDHGRGPNWGVIE